MWKARRFESHPANRPPQGSPFTFAACALFAVALAAVLLFANRALMDAQLHEIADAAANSLLVQDAKSLRLLTGNYSRIGFHHPGPAILYVLAAGEWLFHDVLGLVRSPIAGQLLAVAFYDAAWSSLLLWITSRMAMSRLAGLAAVAAFWAITAGQEPRMLSSLWFPHLYYMPFAVLLAAAARLASGSADGLVPLALAFGFLVHGHVSFAAIGGIVIVGATAVHLAMRTRSDAGALPSRRTVIACGALAAGFAAPIVLHTVLHFPGEIPGYFGYRSPGGHGWIASAGFVSRFWGVGLTPLLAGAAVAGLMVLGGRLAASPPAAAALRGLGWSAAFATLATLLYARFGIDNLVWTYTAYFYLATPALVLALAAVLLATLLRRAAGAVTGLVLAAAIGWAALAVAPLAVDSSPEALQLEDTLAGMRQPVVLDLDTAGDWQHLWGTVAGAAIIEKRRGVRGFCIDAGWQILFTRALRCSEEEAAGGLRLLATTRAWPGTQAPAATLGTIRLMSHRDVVLQPGQPLDATETNAADLAHVLVQGWAAPEKELTWSMDEKARITFRLDAPGAVRLAVDMGAYLPRAGSHQEVRVLARGRVLETWRFEAGNPRGWRSVTLPPEARDAQGRVRLDLEIASRISPASLGLSGDMRMLGVALYRMRVEAP